MKYTLRYTGEFKRSLKRCLKRGYDEQLLTEVLNILAAEGKLPEKYRPHILLVSSKATGSVISLQTGFSSGIRTTGNLCC